MYDSVVPLPFADAVLPGELPRDGACNTRPSQTLLQNSFATSFSKKLQFQSAGKQESEDPECFDAKAKRFRESKDILLQKSLDDLRIGLNTLWEACIENAGVPHLDQQVPQRSNKLSMCGQHGADASGTRKSHGRSSGRRASGSNFCKPSIFSRSTTQLTLQEDEEQEDDTNMPGSRLQCQHCSNIFAEDAIYCRKCGKKRQAVNSQAEQHQESQIVLMTQFIHRHQGAERQKSIQSQGQLWDRFVTVLDWQRVHVMIDFSSLWMTVLYSLHMGLAMDLHQGPDRFSGFDVLDIMFVAFFLVEVSLKVYIVGPTNYFCGSSHYSNWYDIFFLLLDSSYHLLQLAGEPVLALPGVFRLLRLGRITRVLCLLRFQGLQSMLTLLQGMIGGVEALAWSLVLYLIMLYTMSLVFRESLGGQDNLDMHIYFNSMQRSLYTTFRCSFGDCTDADGKPIFEHVVGREEYGSLISLFHSVFLFVVNIGLFNVISATFVESAMQASRSFEQQRQQERLKDELLWASRMMVLVKQLLTYARIELPDDLSESIDVLGQLEIKASVVDEWSADPETKAALRDLEIDPLDDDGLSDILDPDNTGLIKITDLQEGLQKLRGASRRSDVLRIDLMVRDIQRTINGLSQLNSFS